LELNHQIARIRPQSARNLEDLHEVEPPFAALVLGDERLLPTEAGRELRLGEAARLTSLNEPGSKAAIGGTEHRPRHSGCRTIVAGTLSPLSDYPNID
jgi:hypothetical protein